MDKFTKCSIEETNCFLQLARNWIYKKQGFFEKTGVPLLAEYLANQEGKTLYQFFSNEQT